MTALVLPLDQVAHEINARLRLADKAEDHRIAAGLLLIEAQKRVQRGEVIDTETGQPMLWGRWCAANIIGRTPRDIQRVMLLARSPDPVAAREEEKWKNRTDKHRSRAENATDCRVSQPPPVETPSPPPSPQENDPLEAAIAAVKSLPPDDLEDFGR